MKRTVITAIAIALAFGLGVPGSRLANAQTNQVIHVGIAPFEAQAGAYYAQDLGLFKRAHLDVDVQQFGGGSVVAAAIVGGSLDIGVTQPFVIASARRRGIPFVFIAPAYMYDTNIDPPYTALVVAYDSSIHSGRDLNGRTLAETAARSLDEVSMSAWIDQHGGDSRTVKFVELAQSLKADAIAAGRVDAAEIGEPELSRALASKKIRILGKSYDAISKRFMPIGWFTTEDWASKNPDAVRKFAAAINEAAAWAVKNPEAAANVQRKYFKIDYDRAHEYHVRTLDPALIQPLLDAGLKYKILDRPMDARELIWKG
jgi:NitT/TauT family transport system substrate-binding protein